MSGIHDFGCMVNDCPHDAAELIQTDPEWGEVECAVLCHSHYALEYYGVGYPGLKIGSRILIFGTAGSWLFTPEKDGDA